MMTLDQALDRYSETFDENYPLCITSMMSDEEIVEDVMRCIAQNKKAERPVYRRGALY